MRATIDKAGRVVVPKSLRDRLGLEAGSALDLAELDGAVVMRPVGRGVAVVQRDGRSVLAVTEPVRPMTSAELRGLVESVRAWPRD